MIANCTQILRPMRSPRGVVAGVSLVAVALGFAAAEGVAQKPRARDLGIPLDGTPGPLNAITDVAGVEVAHR